MISVIMGQPNQPIHWICPSEFDFSTCSAD